MKTGENGHFEFLGQKVKILAFSHKKLFKNVILIIGNYTNDIRSKNFKKSNISEKKRKLAYIPIIQYTYTKKVLGQNKKAQTHLKSFNGRQGGILPVSYTHLTLPTKRIV